MWQVIWYCKDCELYHYGNCPKIKITITATALPKRTKQKIKYLTYK